MAKKKQGIVDKLLHGDHDHSSEAEDRAAERGEDSEGLEGNEDSDLDPKPAEPSKKVSVEAGAPSESKHHHMKNDKWKKGK